MVGLKKIMKLTQLVVLLVVFGLHFRPTSADFLSDVLGTVCGTIQMGTAAVPCLQKLNERLQPWKDENGKIPKFAACCQLNVFEDCIAEKVKSTCGSASRETIRSVYKSTLAGVNYISQDELSCVDEPWYKSESPVCWDVGYQIIAGAFLAILVLTCCCCCCCSCCRNRRRSKRSSRSAATTFVHMGPTNTSVVPQYQQPPYSYLKTNV